MDNIKIILQARTGSSRLPKKMIMPFCEGKSVLTLLLERLKDNFGNKDIIVATTLEKGDDRIVELSEKLNIPVSRGSETDVLQRFIETAEKYKASKIVRICADNLFLDIESLKLLVDSFRNDDFNDYVSFCKSDGTPSIRTHYGFWAEAVTLNALKKVSSLTNEKIYHEHVTNYIYGNPEIFKCRFLRIDPKVESKENLRLTMDTEKDFLTQQFIYKGMKDKNEEISPMNLIKFIDANQELYEIMHQSIISNSK